MIPGIPDGFLILDKPAGITSAHLLNRVKRSLPRGTKIGHAGTLDKLATGVVIALIGKATKQCERVMGQAKRYEATIRLGATSATDDAEGPMVSVPLAASPPTETDVRSALTRFVGEIEQLPPRFSALKLGGKRASDRVRAGEAIELRPRSIRVDAIELLSFAWPDVAVCVSCGRGTYVRSIARDLGVALGVGGHLAALRRTRVGPFMIERAATLEAIDRDGFEAWLLPMAFGGT